MDTEGNDADAARREAVAALLAADGSLRAALAEGLALFALAVARPTGAASPAGKTSGSSCLPLHYAATSHAAEVCIVFTGQAFWNNHAKISSTVIARAASDAASAQQLADDLLQEVSSRREQVRQHLSKLRWPFSTYILDPPKLCTA